MVIKNSNEVIDQCGMCGEDSHIVLSDDEMRAFLEYLRGGVLIQICLPDLNKCEREFLKSGYCPECQELIFGDGETDRIY